MPSDSIAELIARVDAERMRRRLFYLAKDPLPFRKANGTLPGHDKSTLDEADDYIAGELAACGYAVVREPCPAQAFRCDAAKPAAHQYSAPSPSDPTYTLHNLYADRVGAAAADEIVMLLAHKDSQSWNDSPGAYDNAVGTVALLEVAQLLADFVPQRSLRLLFCNEEHTPWTSVTAARLARARGDNIVALLNTDGLGGKGAEAIASGLMTNASEYAAPEGERLADLMAEVNDRYRLGLHQSKHYNPNPGDDHGSFYKEGFRAVVGNVGSVPYADPDYHLPSDTPEHVDIANVVAATKATLAVTAMLLLGG
ncbi:MAG: M28 family metallopeptidase [Anaerolineae bacterium]